MTNRKKWPTAEVPRYSNALANFLINTTPGKSVLAGITATALVGCGNGETTDTNTEQPQLVATAEATPVEIASEGSDVKGIENAENLDLSMDNIDLDGPLIKVEPNIDQDRYEHLAKYYKEYEQSLGFKYLVGLHEAYASNDLSRLNELGYSKRDIYMIYYVAALHQDTTRKLHGNFVDTTLEFEPEVGSGINIVATQMEFVVYAVPILDEMGVLDKLPKKPEPYPNSNIPLQDASTFGLPYPATSGIRETFGLSRNKDYVEYLTKLLNKQSQDVKELSSVGTDDEYTIGKIDVKSEIANIYETAIALVSK